MINQDRINELNELILNLKRQVEEKRRLTYKESNKESVRKYRTEHKDKFNEYQRNYHKYKMETDPDYKARFNERMKRNYHKRKEKKENKEKISNSS